MGAPASTLDELDGSRVLHALGALAIDLQDFISDLQNGREQEREEDEEEAKRWEAERRDRGTGEGGSERR